MRALLSVLLAVLSGAIPLPAQSSPAGAAAKEHSFDRPVAKKVVDLGPSEYSPGQRVKLSCWFYPAFAVKQLDAAEKGAEWLSIVPGKQEAGVCTQSRAAGESVINPDDWAGYFKGVHGNLVFFDADDGWNGGLPFAIFDPATARKIFEDTAYDATMYNKKVIGPFDQIRFTEHDGQLVLRYLRVVPAECDLYREKAACWEKIRAKLDLKDVPMPVCSDYKRTKSHWPSAVAYPVEVTLVPKAVTKTIDGPVKCWPAD